MNLPSEIRRNLRTLTTLTACECVRGPEPTEDEVMAAIISLTPRTPGKAKDIAARVDEMRREGK